MDDVGGLHANSVSIQDEGYTVAPDASADALDIGAGGLTASAPALTAHPTVLGMPITLSSAQTWAITSEYVLDVTGGVTGSSADALGINIADFASVDLSGANDVGPVSLTAGALHLRGGDLNGADGQTVSVDHAGLQVDDNESTGPLSSTNGFVEIGEWDGNSGTGVEASVNGSVSLDSKSTLDMFINNPGTTPGTDYSQLSATGNIDLGGAALELTLGNDVDGECPPLHVGDVDTIVQTTGGVLSGTFAGVPNGSVVNFGTVCGGEEPSTNATISYTPTSVTATITSPPVNTQFPTISGNLRQGQTLTADPGQWKYNPTSYAYQWERCSPACLPIGGAVGPTYTLTQADVGASIEVRVSATNASGTGAASSFPASFVLPLVPSNVAPPSISGNTTVGQTLAESHGTWTNSPTGYRYQWQDCDNSGNNCVGISGASSQTYTLTGHDVGHTIRAQETATNAGGSSGPASSGATEVVEGAPQAPAKPSSTSPPVVTGTAVAGQTVIATPGTWSGTPPLSYTYQWQLCTPDCANMPAATASSLPLTASDVGSGIRVVVTATNSAGSAIAVSGQVGPVVAAGPTSTQILAALQMLLSLSGKHANIGQLLKHGGYSVSFSAPSAGQLLISWYLAAKGPSVTSARSRVLVAGAGVAFHQAGKATVKVALTGKGRQLLRQAKHLTITVMTSFTPSDYGTVTRVKRFALKRGSADLVGLNA